MSALLRQTSKESPCSLIRKRVWFCTRWSWARYLTPRTRTFPLPASIGFSPPTFLTRRTKTNSSERDSPCWPPGLPSTEISKQSLFCHFWSFRTPRPRLWARWKPTPSPRRTRDSSSQSSSSCKITLLPCLIRLLRSCWPRAATSLQSSSEALRLTISWRRKMLRRRFGIPLLTSTNSTSG